MCFVWISEQTAIISLYNINWLVFITETECVYCAVRTGYLNKFILMRPVITGAQILSQAATWEVCCGKIFLSVFRLSPVTVNPQLLRIHFHGNATLLRRTSGRNLGDLKKQRSFWDLGALGRNVLSENMSYVIKFRDVTSRDDDLSERCAFLKARSQNCAQRLLDASCLSVCPHGTTHLPLNGFWSKINVWVFFENLSRKINFLYNLTIITGTLHERPVHI